ncbi:MAG: hypothetical protein DWQ10_17415, partial [Calditrichaeota bacterium]
MRQVQLKFKQFCYTHALIGVFGRQKGWQVVGITYVEEFKNLYQKIASLIVVNDAIRLTAGYTLYALNKINDVPILIRIVDAGKSSDGRPGNFFAHALIVDQDFVDAFYKCDVFSLFKRDIWLDKWEGEPNDHMETIEIDVDVIPEADTFYQATNFTGGEENLKTIVDAANAALNPRRPQYLVVQPAEHDASQMHTADSIALVQTAWSWIPPSRRKFVTLWSGRSQPRMPGINWLILSKTDRSQLSTTAIGRSYYGFDYLNKNFTQPADLQDKKDSEDVVEVSFSYENLAIRNNVFQDFIADVLNYQGTINNKINGLIERYQENSGHISSQTVVNELVEILLKLDKTYPPEEYLYTFKSLLRLLSVRINQSVSLDNLDILNQAFSIQFPAQALTLLKKELLPALVDVLLDTTIICDKIDGNIVYGALLTEVFKEVDKIKAPNILARVLTDISIWEYIISQMIEESGEDRYLALFIFLLIWDTQNRGNIFARNNSFLPQIKKVLSANASETSREKKWLFRFLEMKATPSQTQTDYVLNELSLLYVHAELPVEKDLVEFYLDSEYDYPRQLGFWIRVYKNPQTRTRDEFNQDVLNKYYQVIIDGRLFHSTFDDDKSLISFFAQEKQLENLEKEIFCRLAIYFDEPVPQYGHRQDLNRSASDNLVESSSYGSSLGNYDDPELKRYFTNLFSLRIPNRGQIFENAFNLNPAGIKAEIPFKKLQDIGYNLNIAVLNIVKNNLERIGLFETLSLLDQFKFSFTKYPLSEHVFAKYEVKAFREKMFKGILIEVIQSDIETIENYYTPLRFFVTLFKLSEFISKTSHQIESDFRSRRINQNKINFFVKLFSRLDDLNINDATQFGHIIAQIDKHPELQFYDFYFKYAEDVELNPTAYFTILILFSRDSYDFNKRWDSRLDDIDCYLNEPTRFLKELRQIIGITVRKCTALNEYEPLRRLTALLINKFEESFNRGKGDNDFDELRIYIKIINEIKNVNQGSFNLPSSLDFNLNQQLVGGINSLNASLTSKIELLSSFYSSMDEIDDSSYDNLYLSTIKRECLFNIHSLMSSDPIHTDDLIKSIKYAKFFKFSNRFDSDDLGLFQPVIASNFSLFYQVFFNHHYEKYSSIEALAKEFFKKIEQPQQPVFADRLDKHVTDIMERFEERFHDLLSFINTYHNLRFLTAEIDELLVLFIYLRNPINKNSKLIFKHLLFSLGSPKGNNSFP